MIRNEIINTIGRNYLITNIVEPSDPKEVVDELVEMKKEMIKMRRALEARQNPSNLVNYGTVNIYEK